MRNRKLIAEWCYEKGRADNVIEKVVKDGKTYIVVNDYEKLRTLFGDLLKGWLPVVLACLAGLDIQQQAWVGVAAVLGHLFPVYYRFQGGKGVATAAGLFIGLYLPAALLAVSAWLLVFILTRISSLAALIATPLTLPLLAWQLPAALLPACVLTLLIVWRHRANLRDLLAGRERHF